MSPQGGVHFLGLKEVLSSFVGHFAWEADTVVDKHPARLVGVGVPGVELAGLQHQYNLGPVFVKELQIAQIVFARGPVDYIAGVLVVPVQMVPPLRSVHHC